MRSLPAWLDMSDAPAFPALRDWRYPEPDEPHPAGDAAMGRKIVEAQFSAGPSVPVYTLAHGYGPLTDFARRLQVAWQSSRHGLWINRYGYLSNEKLDAVGRIYHREA